LKDWPYPLRQDVTGRVEGLIPKHGTGLLARKCPGANRLRRGNRDRSGGVVGQYVPPGNALLMVRIFFGLAATGKPKGGSGIGRVGVRSQRRITVTVDGDPPRAERAGYSACTRTNSLPSAAAAMAVAESSTDHVSTSPLVPPSTWLAGTSANQFTRFTEYHTL